MISSTSEEVGQESLAGGLERADDEARVGGLMGEADIGGRQSGLDTKDSDAFLVYSSLIELVRIISRNLLFRKEEESDLMESPEDSELQGGGFAFLDSVRSCVTTMNPIMSTGSDG